MYTWLVHLSSHYVNNRVNVERVCIKGIDIQYYYQGHDLKGEKDPGWYTFLSITFSTYMTASDIKTVHLQMYTFFKKIWRLAMFSVISVVECHKKTSSEFTNTYLVSPLGALLSHFIGLARSERCWSNWLVTLEPIHPLGYDQLWNIHYSHKLAL